MKKRLAKALDNIKTHLKKFKEHHLSVVDCISLICAASVVIVTITFNSTF